MSNNLASVITFLTPVPIPRGKNNEPRGENDELFVSGCAAPHATEPHTHIFLDENNRKAHKLCAHRPVRYGAHYSNYCEPGKIVGNRYWDFRDKSDHRSNPEQTPFWTIMDFLVKNVKQEDWRKKLFGKKKGKSDSQVFEATLLALAMCPNKGRGLYDSLPDSLFPLEPVDGYLRSWSNLTQQQENDSVTPLYYDEGFVLNRQTLHKL